jgi:hypothetical protein
LPDFTAPEDEAFFAAIGRLTIAWAHLELGLDWLVRIIHHNLGGRERIAAIEPISLKRKLDYLRTAFRSLPDLASFKDRFPRIADEIRAAAPKPFAVTTELILKATDRANKIYVLQFADEVVSRVSAT